LKALRNQLFVPGFKNVQVQTFARVHHNAKRKNRDEIGHSP
jgi:hypothetical protein